MILAIDIGNTNIVLGGWEGDKLRFVSRLETNKTRTEDSYAVQLKNVLELYSVQSEKIEGSVISSVVPQINTAISRGVEKLTGKAPLVLGPGVKTGLDIRIDNLSAVGSDLVAAAVAAIQKYPKPLIIFDLGTANTISVVDRDGSFLGGVILPGIRIGLDALSRNAAMLPQIGLDAPRDIIGRNTVDSMKSGAIYGTASMMDGMASRIEDRLGQKATIVATGGNSKDIIPYCRCDIIYDGDLLLEGLLRIYRKNIPLAD